MKTCVAAAIIALAAASSASAELVARGVSHGLAGRDPAGRAYVAYLRGTTLVVARRVAARRWRNDVAARVAKGSSLAAFAVGRRGPVAVVLGPGERSVSVFHRRGHRWRTTPIERRVGPGAAVGWPGLALDRSGLPVVAYTRWRQRSRASQLVLARLTARGVVRTERITRNGFPESYVPPPAAPIVMPNGRVHVVETYGISSTVATIEWLPTRKSWVGQFISGGVGDFPVGPMFGLATAANVVYAAWTEAFLAWDEFPVTLATHGRAIDADFVLDRALTTGLALSRTGPQVVANEWVSGAQLGLDTEDVLWAGTVTGRGGGEVDGWIDGIAADARRDSRDLLLAGPRGISWFRVRGSLPRVMLAAEVQDDSSITLSGRVRGAARGGKVELFREWPGSAREVAGTARLSGGSFTFVDSPRPRPVLYRAVYTDPASGIPYARLLREPVG
jgi:hypothetical protein